MPARQHAVLSQFKEPSTCNAIWKPASSADPAGRILLLLAVAVSSALRAHIPAPSLANPVVLYRQAGALWCRAPGAFDVDGKTCAARAPRGQEYLRVHAIQAGTGAGTTPGTVAAYEPSPGPARLSSPAHPAVPVARPGNQAD